MLVESLRQYYLYYGDEVTIECPTGSGRYLTLDQVADDLSGRLIHIFTCDEQGRRAVFGDVAYFQSDPHWRDYIPFYEYFHGDSGRGVGAWSPDGLDWPGRIADPGAGGAQDQASLEKESVLGIDKVCESELE